MPKKAPAESLESFLGRQDASTLAALLVELAGEHESVQARLVRLQLADRPDKLAAAFKKTLAGWRRSTRFHDYHQARERAREFEAWLDQVDRELTPKDPPAAVALFEDFIEADAKWIDNADDSDGRIGEAIGAACRHWLRAAAQCETPADVWPARLMKLYEGNDHGAREELLLRADLLLAEPALRQLVSLFEAHMAQALKEAPKPPARMAYGVFKASAALSLLSEALRDPDIKVRATLSYSPDPNPLQREAFAQAYLKFDRPADALPWLQGPWGHTEHARQALLSEALRRLGRLDESAPIRQQMFERSFSVFDLRLWLEHLSADQHPAALSHAHQLAIAHEHPAAAAAVLLELGDAKAAEAQLTANAGRIDGSDYGSLLPLAKQLRSQERFRGEAAVYRALLRAILDRGYAAAYGHAARYWTRLYELADTGTDLAPLQPHPEFEAEIRARHTRKASFWAHVKAKQVERPDDGEIQGLEP